MDAKPKKRKGNPYVPLRIDAELLAWIDEQVKRSQETSDEPYDRSSFIRACIRERRAKHIRARESETRKRAAKGKEATPTENPPELS